MTDRVLAIVLLMIGLGFLSSVWQYRNEAELLDHGSRTVGVLMAKREEFVKGSHPDAWGEYEYFVYYDFELADGRSMTGRGSVPFHVYTRLEMGDSIEIAYDNTDPTKRLPISQKDRKVSAHLG